MENYLTYSEQETENLAFNMAKKFNSNTIIVLSGDLGTGKTRFVKGIARYFGVENLVSSPTFTIVNEYATALNVDKANKIYHFDVYRLKDGDDFINSIGTDYFSSGLCVIEWGEIIQDILPKGTIFITISRSSKKNPDERTVLIKEI